VADFVDLTADDLDLHQIEGSGQCFRLREYDRDRFIAVTSTHAVDIHRRTGGYRFWCAQEEFDRVWRPYFDLDTDYAPFKAKMQADPFLKEALKTCGGVRILRQDLWETAVTFVISQRSNIPRIRRSVETLCQDFGTVLGEVGGETVRAFPTPAQLRGQDLSDAALGYRQKYVEALAACDEGLWRKLPGQSDEEAKRTLLSLYGVGEKVANCILLYGLHRLSSYPRDVWVNRLVDDVYHGDFDPEAYPGFAGYVQQVQFYSYREGHKTKSFTNPNKRDILVLE
jgi:N-glycosylase/DNA lyase